MSSFTLDTSQARALASRIEGNAGRIGAAGSAVLRRAALAIEADAKALAPVDTGALRASISSSFTGDGRGGAMTAEVGPTVEYGVYLEYGTSVMGAQPFMGPAFDRQIGSYTAAVGALLDQVL